MSFSLSTTNRDDYLKVRDFCDVLIYGDVNSPVKFLNEKDKQILRDMYTLMDLVYLYMKREEINRQALAFNSQVNDLNQKINKARART